VAFQESVLQEIRIKESFSNKSENEIEVFRNNLKEITEKGFASIKSNQYAGLHAISFPILDLNKNAIAAMTVPMLARIDGEKQVEQRIVEEELRKSAESLSMKIIRN
jgi:DNA-binding IclR family transcriptional regulator